MTLTGLESTDHYAWFVVRTCSSAITWLVSCIITQCFLHRLYSSNETENAVYDRLDAAVSKYVHGYKYNLTTDEIWPVIDMVMILNFLEQLFSNSRKFKMISITTIHYISSAFDLYSNPCAYLEITSFDL